MAFGIQSVSGSQNSPFTNATGPFANLNLTSQQQQQLQQIFGQARSNGSTPAQVQSQVDAVLTPQQQQTFQSDAQQLKSQHHGHHHHAGSGSSGASGNSSSLLSQLDLTSDQQTQIGQLVQSAQSNGTSPSDLLSQIDDVLTTSQQSQLNSLLSSPTYSSTGGTTAGTSYLVNTSA